MPATEVREILGRARWDSYYKFCFERNPWDKVVSWYYWETRNNRPVDFDDFMTSQQFLQVGGYDFYTDSHDEIMVDDVYKYERLEDAISRIEVRLGTTLPDLPRAKSQFRDNRTSFREMFSEDQVRLVRDAFRREIATFEYGF